MSVHVYNGIYTHMCVCCEIHITKILLGDSECLLCLFLFFFFPSNPCTQVEMQSVTQAQAKGSVSYWVATPGSKLANSLQTLHGTVVGTEN